MLLARALVPDGAERLDDAAVLGLAARLEGHPDNAAAALLGGFTIAWPESSGARAVRLAAGADSLRAVVLLPDSTLDTELARGLLPANVPHVDAAHTAARSALLVHAMTASPDLLLAATEDRLHQAYRESAMPRDAGRSSPCCGPPGWLPWSPAPVPASSCSAATSSPRRPWPPRPVMPTTAGRSAAVDLDRTGAQLSAGEPRSATNSRVGERIGALWCYAQHRTRCHPSWPVLRHDPRSLSSWSHV